MAGERSPLLEVSQEDEELRIGESRLEVVETEARPRLTRSGIFSDRKLVSRPLPYLCDSHGSDRECPMCTAYASTKSFWKEFAFQAFAGAFLGVMCFTITYPMERLPVLWTSAEYPSNVETVRLLRGKFAWVGIIGCSGLLVGLCKVAVQFPSQPTGLFKQVMTMYVHPVEAAKVVFVTMVSISGGAALGPTGALTTFGGGIAQILAEYLALPDEKVQKICIFGMCSALGGLFPSPVTAILLVVELGPTDDVHASYLRYFLELGVGVVSSFAVYYYLSAGKPYLPFLPFRYDLEHDAYQFQLVHLAYAVVIGVLCGLLGTLQLVLVGMAKYCFRLMEQTLGGGRVAQILTPGVGGVLIGLLSVIVPLSFGSGNSQLLDVINQADSGLLSPELLMLSALGKMVAVAISVGSGWVGGVIFPMYFVGVTVGLATFQWIGDSKDFPLVLLLSCFICGVPASLFPIPLTQLVTAGSMMELGAAGSAPMLVASMTANCVSSGSGILAKMFRFAKREHLFDNPILET